MRARWPERHHQVTLDPARPTLPTRVLTPTSMPCPIGSKPSAARFAISSTRPTTRLPKRSNAPTVRTSYCRATSARCWRRTTTSTCFSTTARSSLIRRESSSVATRTRARARCPSARANTSEDERFQAAAARSHVRFVLEAERPLRAAEGVMTLLCRLRGADRHIVRRRLLLSVERAGLRTREIDSAVGAERVTRPGDATAARQSLSCACTRPHRSPWVSRRPNRRPRSEAGETAPRPGPQEHGSPMEPSAVASAPASTASGAMTVELITSSAGIPVRGSTICE